MKRRDLLALTGGSITVAIAGCMGDDEDDDSEDDGTEDTSDDTDNEDDGTPDGSEDDGEEEQTPASFDVSSITVAEATVSIGVDIELSVEITNSGEASGSQSVELQRGDAVVDTQELSLDGGDSETVELADTGTGDLVSDDYTYTVSTEDDEASEQVSIREPAAFEVTNLDPETAEISLGELLDVTGQIENTGELSGTTDVELRIDGETVAEQELELDGGESKAVEFLEIDTVDLAVGEFEHSIWTPDDEQVGTLSITEGTLEPGTLDLSVVDVDGVAIEGASVTGEEIDATTDAEGQVELELDPGTYELVISFEELETTRTVEIQEGTTTSETVSLTGEPEISGLDGINTSGFTAFDEDTEQDARDGGISFPEGDVEIAGTVDSEANTWQSTNVSFAELQVSGLPVTVEAIDGLSGTFDSDAEIMTAEGELEVTVDGDSSFTYTIAATTEESGALTGSADFGADSGTATIVDNEFTVEDTTGDPVLDSVLGLPIEESGRAWLELTLDFDFQTEA